MESEEQGFQRRKPGLANHYSLLLRLSYDREATLGIMELSRQSVHSDGEACYVDVGSSYPGCAQAAKGAGVHRLKGIVSWV